MRAYLDGKKTYVVAVVGVLAAVGSWLAGEMSIMQAVELALLSLGLGTLRAGVAKS